VRHFKTTERDNKDIRYRTIMHW